MRKSRIALIAILLVLSGVSYAQQAAGSAGSSQIHVLPVRDHVYMLLGDGGNIVLQTGDEGAFVVDSGEGKLSDKVIAAIRRAIELKAKEIILRHVIGKEPLPESVTERITPPQLEQLTRKKSPHTDTGCQNETANSTISGIATC